MSKHPHHELAEAWFRRAWTELDPAAVDEIFDAEGVVEGLGETIHGPDAFRAFQAQMLELVQDVEVDVLEHFHDDAGGNMVLCALRAVSRRTQRPVAMTGSVRYRVRDGKVKEVRDHWDWMSFWEQLELLPQGSFLAALSGARVGQ
ncbi:MAG: nuclear transport factor 2 family protein [Planctomycetota bacterium]